MNNTPLGPSLFDDGQIGQTLNNISDTQINQHSQLIDLLYDGFYIVFLLRNGYVPQNAEDFRSNIVEMLEQFEQQARKAQIKAEDTQDAKYAYCALLDECIVSQQSASFFQLQNVWLINPLQLSLFGSQLAGDRFYDILEKLRAHGKHRLGCLELFHYCMLLGFQGKYRLEPAENLNHLVARVGDEIDYLKANKAGFAPFAYLPDNIKNMIHNELPFFWILLILLIFAIMAFVGLNFMLYKNEKSALSAYQNVIAAPQEQAHITLHLP